MKKQASKQASKPASIPQAAAAAGGRALSSLLDLVFLPFLICQQESTFAFMHFTPKNFFNCTQLQSQIRRRRK
jgi:hypothetical protein